MPDITTEADVRVLVDTFYEKVREDALLDPIFSDVAKVDWEHHLPKMYAFWNGMILGKAGRPDVVNGLIENPTNGVHSCRRFIEIYSCALQS